MAKRATLTLDGMKAAKSPSASTGGATEAQTSSPKQKASDNRRGQTIRLTVDAWRQLKHMAADEQRTSHALLIEAVNMLFQNRGKPPIA